MLGLLWQLPSSQTSQPSRASIYSFFVRRPPGYAMVKVKTPAKGDGIYQCPVSLNPRYLGWYASDGRIRHASITTIHRPIWPSRDLTLRLTLCSPQIHTNPDTWWLCLVLVRRTDKPRNRNGHDFFCRPFTCNSPSNLQS